MDRRTFIGGTASTVAALAGVSACTGEEQGVGVSASSGPPLTTTAGAVSPSPSAPANWAALARELDGTLVRPGDAEWKTARQLYNTRFDSLKPAAVAYVRHADDIRTALAYARAHRVGVAIRNGGHSYAGWSSGDDRLIVDVSALSTVRASGTSAVVGAGAKLIDVYRALAAKGTTIPAGSCPTVGVSGLTLGGGHGVVSRAYGLTCDSLTAASIVTADGRQLTVDAKNHQDLFWALRGAGNGNFGVVTELHFRTHPAPQAVTAYLSWPWAKAAAVLKAWQEWGAGPAGRDLVGAASVELRRRQPDGDGVRVLPGHVRRAAERRRPPRRPGRAGPRRACRCAAVRTRRRWRSTPGARRSRRTPSAICRAPRRAGRRRARCTGRRTRPAPTSSTVRFRPTVCRRC
ncbi:hypothetical protein GCM10020256_41050 [Streptomyces thermocoprophilus]